MLGLGASGAKTNFQPERLKTSENRAWYCGRRRSRKGRRKKHRCKMEKSGTNFSWESPRTKGRGSVMGDSLDFGADSRRHIPRSRMVEVQVQNSERRFSGESCGHVRKNRKCGLNYLLGPKVKISGLRQEEKE